MRDSYWLLLISILIMLPRIISESLFRFTSLKMIWVFRIIDIFDITLQTVSLFALILYIYSKYIYERGKKCSTIYMILASLLIGGHMMHFAANALDMHFREVLNENPSDVMPYTAYVLLHFIDEYLSHIIMFTALVMIISMGSLAETYNEQKELKTLDRGIIMFSGIVLGGGLGISAVEASIPLYVLALAIINLLIIVYHLKIHQRDVRQYPFTLYALMLLTMLILSIIIFIIIFGFASPREIIGSFIEEKFSEY